MDRIVKELIMPSSDVPTNLKKALLELQKKDGFNSVAHYSHIEGGNIEIEIFGNSNILTYEIIKEVIESNHVSYNTISIDVEIGYFTRYKRNCMIYDNPFGIKQRNYNDTITIKLT